MVKIRAEFLGGPWDGKVVLMDAELPFRFALPPPLPSIIARQENLDLSAPQIDVMQIYAKMQSNGVWILDWNDRT